MTDVPPVSDPIAVPDDEPDDEPVAPNAVIRGPRTLAAMRRALDAESSAVTAAARNLEAARAAYESVTRREAYSSDESHATAVRDYTPPLVAVERAAARAATAAQGNVRAILAQLPAARMVVPPAVEAVAATRAVVLGTVVDTAPIPQLRDDLNAAIVAGDAASMYVLASLLPARLAAEAAPNEAGRPEIGQARAEITGLLARVRDDLRDTSADPIRALVAEVRDRAAGVARAAHSGR